jgi:hypothetical protein
MLLVNFKIDNEFLNSLGILNGTHDFMDFNVDWYKEIGINLCITLLGNTMTPHGGKIIFPIYTCLSRWHDRGYSDNVEKHCDKHGAKEVNSKQLVQDDLEKLYTGPEITTHLIYAQFFTSLLCIMTYSSGLPILYPIGCLNYFILYWVYKILLIKHY